MAHFKIIKEGCLIPSESFQSTYGLIQVQALFYLDKDDAGYAESFQDFPIIPVGGYPGEKDADGFPVSEEDYKTWEESLPRETKQVALAGYVAYFEDAVSLEEILFCFEMALENVLFQQKLGYSKNNFKSIPAKYKKKNNIKDSFVTKLNEIKNSDFAAGKSKLNWTCRIK